MPAPSNPLRISVPTKIAQNGQISLTKNLIFEAILRGAPHWCFYALVLGINNLVPLAKIAQWYQNELKKWVNHRNGVYCICNIANLPDINRPMAENEYPCLPAVWIRGNLTPFDRLFWKNNRFYSKAFPIFANPNLRFKRKYLSLPTGSSKTRFDNVSAYKVSPGIDRGRGNLRSDTLVGHQNHRFADWKS